MVLIAAPSGQDRKLLGGCDLHLFHLSGAALPQYFGASIETELQIVDAL